MVPYCRRRGELGWDCGRKQDQKMFNIILGLRCRGSVTPAPHTPVDEHAVQHSGLLTGRVVDDIILVKQRAAA